MRPKKAVGVTVTVLFCLSCGRGGKEATRDGSKGIYLDEFSIGRGVSAQGVATDQKSVFKQGDPIYASFVVQNAPDSAKARVIWDTITKGTTKVAEQEKLLGKKGFVSFNAGDTSKWKPDDYRLEIFLIDDPSKPAKSLGINDFKVIPGP
jgi:hypothetical protein